MMKRMRAKVRPTVYPVMLVALLVCVGVESTRAPTINNDLIPYLDKMIHFLVFGIIACLTAMTISTRPGRSGALLPACASPLILVSFAFTVLAGLSNEWIQSFTPGRVASVGDVLADVIGAAVFLAGLKLIHMTSRRRKVEDAHHMPVECTTGRS